MDCSIPGFPVLHHLLELAHTLIDRVVNAIQPSVLCCPLLLLPSVFPSIRVFSLPAAAAAAKSFQSCLTLCDPLDGSPPGSPVPGILQARTLEWVAISFSNAWKWKVKVKWLSHVWLFATPWTAAFQASPSVGFSRLEYRSGVTQLFLVYKDIFFFNINTVETILLV